ncbi:hypothetical protein C5167_000851 [Papaver somniferum]|uniref:Uncharacterized protein n=1 Tax=Papaver somniferum TaxID=3469 RepID=A0A4Y7KTL6_PAPSO|nr:hypothetical protein C5167_000851 [Papaver somniferum]
MKLREEKWRQLFETSLSEIDEHGEEEGWLRSKLEDESVVDQKNGSNYELVMLNGIDGFLEKEKNELLLFQIDKKFKMRIGVMGIDA